MRSRLAAASEVGDSATHRSCCLLGLWRITGRCFQVRCSSELSPGGSFPRGSSSSLPPHISAHDWLQNFAVGGPQTSPAAGWEHLTQCCWHHFPPGLLSCPCRGIHGKRAGVAGQEGAMAGCAAHGRIFHSPLLQFL